MARIRALSELGNNLRGRLDPHIGHEQQCFQLLEEIVINGLSSRETDRPGRDWFATVPAAFSPSRPLDFQASGCMCRSRARGSQKKFESSAGLSRLKRSRKLRFFFSGSGVLSLN